MKLSILIILLFVSCTGFGQSFGRIYIDLPKDHVENDIDKQIIKGKKKSNINFAYKISAADTLSYTIGNNVDCFVVKMTFNLKHQNSKNERCSFQEYLFNCAACAQNHLQETLKRYRFRQKSADVYISSFFNKVEMTVHNNSKNSEGLILNFRYLDLKKKEYKRLYKNLKTKTTA